MLFNATISLSILTFTSNCLTTIEPCSNISTLIKQFPFHQSPQTDRIAFWLFLALSAWLEPFNFPYQENAMHPITRKNLFQIIANKWLDWIWPTDQNRTRLCKLGNWIGKKWSDDPCHSTLLLCKRRRNYTLLLV